MKFCILRFSALLSPQHPGYGRIDGRVTGRAGIVGDHEETIRAVLKQLLADNHLIYDDDEGGGFYEQSTAPKDDAKEKMLWEKMKQYGYFLELTASLPRPGAN